MEEQKFSIRGLIQKVKEYIQNRKVLTKLVIVERISTIVASMITDLLVIILGFFVLFFLSVALGLYIGELVGSSALGFLILGGIYGLLILIIVLAKKNIENKLMNFSIGKFLKDWNDIDED